MPASFRCRYGYHQECNIPSCDCACHKDPAPTIGTLPTPDKQT